LSLEISNILAYGITFGILIMSIFYTFIRYVYSRELLYFSYFVMQLFSLFYIAIYSELFNIPTLYKDLSLAFAIIGAVLFSISFYEGEFTPKIKNYQDLIKNSALVYLVLLTVFYHYILFEYLPYTIVYGILLLSVVFNLRQGFNPTVFYVLGWFILCLLLFAFDMKEYFIQTDSADIVLIAFAIEALLFTTSISYKYVLLKKEALDYQNMLLQQSKMAQSGEMIGNITHQFRQPLNNLSYILMNIKKRYENGKIDHEYFNKKFYSAQDQIQFLSKTIDDFKAFYLPSKHKEEFRVKEAIENTLRILSADLKHRGISIHFEFNTDENIKVYGIKNELSQVFLALLTNATEALRDREEARISIDVNASSAEVIIRIQDNAKGINPKHLEKIFQPYFSTKEQGTGIGLYLVKLIIEKSFEGKIAVKNQTQGACFTLSLEKVI